MPVSSYCRSEEQSHKKSSLGSSFFFLEKIDALKNIPGFLLEVIKKKMIIQLKSWFNLIPNVLLSMTCLLFQNNAIFNISISQ